jgi:hypothetical protein
VILVSGYVPDAIAAGTTSDSNTVAPMLPFLWPVVWLCIMIVGTFWVGERREWYKLKRAHKLKAGARP